MPNQQGMLLSVDTKPRLKWSRQLHEQFVEAISELGGAESWDTDQFLTDIGEATLIMLSLIRNGGLAPGGFNFDAKLRRESTDVEDIFLANISGMDIMARGLRNAAKLIEDGSLAELVRKRCQSFDSEFGAQIEVGKADFEILEKKAIEWGEPYVPSGKQVWFQLL